MISNKLQQQIEFIVEIDKLKSIIRQTHLISGERQENSAEHSWHIALVALVLAEHSNEPFDPLRVVKMLLIHDIVEIDAGDVFCYDEVGYVDKYAREQQAAERLFGLLPSEQEAEFMALWHEFEARQTPEARFANAADRIMPLLHNYHTKGSSWQKHGIVKAQVYERCKPIGEASTSLSEFVVMLVEDAVKQGILSKK